jgi:hypothetical protein
MDESFQLRARRLLGKQQEVALDFQLLTATLAAQRSACAKDARSVPAAEGATSADRDPLTEIVLAGPDWPRAASAQQGCFNRAEAGRRRNTL